MVNQFPFKGLKTEINSISTPPVVVLVVVFTISSIIIVIISHGNNW